MGSGVLPAEVLPVLQDWKDKKRPITILVIGDSGSGKTSLACNLLGEDIAWDNAQSVLSTSRGVFQGVPVTVHETSGLENPDGERDPKYRNEMQSLLSGGGIDVIIYCIKANETRMRESLTRALKEYRDMGLDWRKTVIALTFADFIPIPKTEKQAASCAMEEYFNRRVTELKDAIKQTLTKHVGIPSDLVATIPMGPTRDDVDDRLPNEEHWYESFWSYVLICLKVAPSPSSTKLTLQLSTQLESLSTENESAPLASDSSPKETSSVHPQAGSCSWQCLGKWLHWLCCCGACKCKLCSCCCCCATCSQNYK